MAIAAGTFLGPYEVLASLGSGGMGEVYRARDTRLSREVAIKVLPASVGDDPEALMRFEREARTASALNHPAIVTIYDFGSSDGLHYLAMELIRGTSLREHMQEDVATLVGYLIAIADGLARAHENGIVHRDLKPENVMISEDGYAKLVDFGLAKPVAPIEELKDAVTAPLTTAAGTIIGTVGYVAPEQLTGGVVDHRADIFSFGCMLHEAVTKDEVFRGDSKIDTMHRIIYSEAPPLPIPALDRIAQRCLQKNPAARYSSMRDVASDLRNAITRPMERVAVRAHRPYWAYATAAAVIAALLFAWLHRRPATISSVAVLPFHNAGVNTEAAFLSDGIAEEVVNDLSRIPALRVIASSSVAKYRGHDADPRAAARELNVDAVLVGNLRTADGVVSLDAQLVRASDGTALWGKRYSRTLANVITLEAEIARDLCDEVRLKLAPPRNTTHNAAAYEAYLRGQQEFRKQTAPGLKAAIEHFNHALELDPQFADAWAALAQAHGRQGILGIVQTRDGLLQEEAEARKALAIDDTLAQAHWTLALAAGTRGDREEHDRQRSRVLELDPNFAPAYFDRANNLVLLGKVQEGIDTFEQARRLDPLSPSPASSFGIHLYLVRHYDEALKTLTMVSEQFPEYANAHAYLAQVYSVMGRNAEAIAAIDREKAEDNPNIRTWRGIVLARAGRVAEARAIADSVDSDSKTRFNAPYQRAGLRAVLGDRDRAIGLLEEAKRDGDWHMSWLPFDPSLDSLRSDPRFGALMK
jgi:TolB-like protein/Flp pilus assembly protein TadD